MLIKQISLTDYLDRSFDGDGNLTVTPQELALSYGMTIEQAQEALDWADYERHEDESRLYGRFVKIPTSEYYWNGDRLVEEEDWIWQPR